MTIQVSALFMRWQHFKNNLSSLGSSVGDEVNHSVGVTEFVIIPTDQFDKVVIQLDACIGIKDG